MAIDLKKLIQNQVHYGHQTSRWNPKMEPYIWGQKNNIHLIDVSKTAHALEQASRFLESLASEGKVILWVGTKKAAQETIQHTAQGLHQPYVVHRWVGGTFSNYRQIRKLIANLLHYEDIVSKAEQSHYNKKEVNLFQKRIDRLQKIAGGIRTLGWPIGAVVIVDVKKEHVALKEALSMGIPVVALVDTNSDPSDINFPIPANDDAPRAIKVVIDYLAQAVARGQEVAAARPQAEIEAETLRAYEDSGLLESEEDEEGDGRRRSAGARGKKAVGTKTRARRPGEGERRRPKAHVDVANSDATIQTPELETQAQTVTKQEPTIEMPRLETKTKKVAAEESTIQTPATETPKKGKNK